MDTLFGEQLQDGTEKALHELWKTPGWPVDPVRDRSLISELQKQFPGVDLTEEFQKFRVWLIERGSGKEAASRGRYRRVREWVRRAGGPGRAPTGPTGIVGGKTGPRRSRTAARPAEAFGTESSQALARW